jgi:hypothetical protein
VQNKTITIVWTAGLGLALLIYVAGPDQAIATLFRMVDASGNFIQHALVELSGRAFDVLRALAIGCFVIFFTLCIVASGRGLPVRWLLPVVCGLFLLLVWHEGPEATGHWVLAFVLSAAAAINVTRRLTDSRPRPVWNTQGAHLPRPPDLP